jgi:hypothetical protein
MCAHSLTLILQKLLFLMKNIDTSFLLFYTGFFLILSIVLCQYESQCCNKMYPLMGDLYIAATQQTKTILCLRIL